MELTSSMSFRVLWEPILAFRAGNGKLLGQISLPPGRPGYPKLEKEQRKIKRCNSIFVANDKIP